MIRHLVSTRYFAKALNVPLAVNLRARKSQGSSTIRPPVLTWKDLSEGDWLKNEPWKFVEAERGESVSALQELSDLLYSEENREISSIAPKRFLIRHNRWLKGTCSPHSLWVMLRDARDVLLKEGYPPSLADSATKLLWKSYMVRDFSERLEMGNDRSFMKTSSEFEDAPSDLSVLPRGIGEACDVDSTLKTKLSKRKIPDVFVNIEGFKNMDLEISKYVFLSNLPRDVSISKIRETFDRIGNITKIDLFGEEKIQSLTFSGVTGVVEFETSEQAKACARDSLRLFGVLCKTAQDPRSVFPETCERKKTLIISGVSWALGIEQAIGEIASEISNRFKECVTVRLKLGNAAVVDVEPGLEIEAKSANFEIQKQSNDEFPQHDEETLVSSSSGNNGIFVLRFKSFHEAFYIANACKTAPLVVGGRQVRVGFAERRCQWVNDKKFPGFVDFVLPESSNLYDSPQLTPLSY